MMPANKTAAESVSCSRRRIRIASPSRSARGHGFSGNGVASQIVTLPSGPLLARR
jgi:hypothetical protein